MRLGPRLRRYLRDHPKPHPAGILTIVAVVGVFAFLSICEAVDRVRGRE